MVFWRKRRPKVEPGFLEAPLLDLGGIPFTGKMATEGIFTIAELGWGKTFLVFQRVLRAYVRAGIGGMVLGAKPEDLPQVQKLFDELGAGDRLTVLSPTSGYRCNWFEQLAAIAPRGAETEEIVGGLASNMEIQQRSAGKSGGEDSVFFTTQAMLLLSAVITVLRLAGERINAPNIHRFILSLPQTAEQLGSEEWRSGSYANQCMAKAYNAVMTDEERADYEAASLYLFAELLDLNSRTRSSIVSTVTAMLSKMLRGWVRTLWSSTSNVRLQDAFTGQWFYIDTSPLEYGEYGVTSLVMVKHLFQRMVMRRRIDEASRPVALMFDEAQAVFVTADRDYQAVCRSKLGLTWAATQNLTGLFSALGGGQAAESQVKSWVALFGCRIFGANSCWATNTYASEMCGQVKESLLSGNTSHQPQETAWDAFMGNFNSSSGWSEHYNPVVRPEHFVRLRKPEPPRYEAEAVVVMARLQAMIGRHWAEVTFRPGE